MGVAVEIGFVFYAGVSSVGMPPRESSEAVVWSSLSYVARGLKLELPSRERFGVIGMPFLRIGVLLS